MFLDVSCEILESQTLIGTEPDLAAASRRGVLISTGSKAARARATCKVWWHKSQDAPT